MSTLGPDRAAQAPTDASCVSCMGTVPFYGLHTTEQEALGTRHRMVCAVCGRELQPSWFVPRPGLKATWKGKG